jgi:hypothetical protein
MQLCCLHLCRCLVLRVSVSASVSVYVSVYVYSVCVREPVLGLLTGIKLNMCGLVGA